MERYSYVDWKDVVFGRPDLLMVAKKKVSLGNVPIILDGEASAERGWHDGQGRAHVPSESAIADIIRRSKVR
jgi:hypothetical protein